MMRHLPPLVLAAVLAVPAAALTAEETPAAIDWAAFLARNDQLWTTLPEGWNNGAFTGNGRLGTILWQDKDGSLHCEISRADIYDHRHAGLGAVFARYRLPNGHLALRPSGAQPAGGLRLDLWNAEVRGTITTATGRLAVRTYTHATEPVMVFETTASGGEAPTWTWHPVEARSYREKGVPKDYRAYPPPTASVVDGIQVSVQDMPEDKTYATDGEGVGQYATAWRSVGLGGGRTVTYVAMGYSWPGATARQEAIDAVAHAAARGPEVLEASHRQWWHAYYPRSFLSVPDAAIEGFYWSQIYKMGSASRAGGPLIDLAGPWYQKSTWPAVWWNLNIQLTYWPFYVSNHLDEAQPLLDTLWERREALAANAKPFQADSYAIGRATGLDCQGGVGKEVGNLPWTMHNLWLHYRSAMDDRMLAERLLPLMKGSLRYFTHILKDGADGRLHLPITASPEYADEVEDCTYTTACLRWLAGAIIQADARLKANDPLVATCRDILTRLAPYAIDDSGFMVGKGMPFVNSHRHWSHLFPIHPFHEYGFDDPAQAPLVERSLRNWLGKPKAFAGYSFLGGASMEGLAGRGDEALKLLKGYLGFRGCLPNTLYREAGPVIETPLAFARSLQDLMLTSHGDLIRVFPGVPEAWEDVAFDRFRAEGAFLVSARRAGKITRFVRIESLAGEPCRIRTSLAAPVVARGDRDFTVVDHGGGVVELDLRKGETAILSSAEPATVTAIAPVALSGGERHWGGVKPAP